MNLKIGILLTSALLLGGLQSCGNSEVEEEAPVEESTVDLAEQRRLELIEKNENDSLTLEEWSELDSLEMEKYKKELENAVLQKVADEGE